jgi:hypothetical protein
VTGGTYSTNFPITTNAFQKTNKAGFAGANAYLTKFSSTGSSLIYSTYLGGESAAGTAIALNLLGNAYILGDGYSSGFPLTSDAYATTSGVFLTEFSADGSSLVYSGFLGSSGPDIEVGLAFDSLGNAYVAGWTNETNDQASRGAFQPVTHAVPSNGEYSNGFISKLALHLSPPS